MSDRLLKESDVMRIAFQLPLVVNSAFADAVKALPSADRPQEWVDKAISIINDMQSEGIVDYEQAREFRMRARLKGADDADG